MCSINLTIYQNLATIALLSSKGRGKKRGNTSNNSPFLSIQDQIENMNNFFDMAVSKLILNFNKEVPIVPSICNTNSYEVKYFE